MQGMLEIFVLVKQRRGKIKYKQSVRSGNFPVLSTVQYSTVQYSTIQYNTVQYSTQYTVHCTLYTVHSTQYCTAQSHPTPKVGGVEEKETEEKEEKEKKSIC